MYRTFLRTAKNFEEFAKAPKMEVETGLTQEEARANCKEFNDNRTEEQEEKGTKLEFEKE